MSTNCENGRLPCGDWEDAQEKAGRDAAAKAPEADFKSRRRDQIVRGLNSLSIRDWTPLECGHNRGASTLQAVINFT
jgi:hypothetical protein